jgi:hypothetical protein
MNTGASGCGLLIMGALAAILGGKFGFPGIFMAIVIFGAIATAIGGNDEEE